jgi:hypothetical protein
VTSITPGGVGGELTRPEQGRFLVAPTATDRINVLRPALRPTACWRIESHRFDVGSSFVLPNGSTEFALLARLRPVATDQNRATALRLAIFGHADATGSVSDNKTLSGRRALAVYGLIVRDLALWEELYSNKAGSDDWGLRSVQWMLNALGHPAGLVTGKSDPKTEAAIRHFQGSAGLATSGTADAATRKALFEKYMDLLCSDESGAPFRYEPKDFLGEGKDASRKGACQGCSEHNPVVVPSKKHAGELAKAANKGQRDEEYRQNRRVIIYMFDPGLPIDVTNWPCPTTDEGPDGCKKVFWKDGAERREPSAQHREHARQEATFSCRFYDSMTRFSPCEAPRRTVAVWLHDHARKRMADAPFRLTVAGETILGRSDGEGKARAEGVFKERDAVLEWGSLPALVGAANGSTEPGFLYRTTLRLDIDDFRECSDDELLHEASARLENLGYHRGNFFLNWAAFQKDYGLAESDWPDAATQDALWSTHAGGQETNATQGEEACPPLEPVFEPIATKDSR